MALDKKITTVFIITSIVITGTALAAILTTNTTTKTLLFGDNPVISTTTTTTTVSDAKPVHTEVTVTATKEADLAAVILRILGIQINIEEITTFKSRNMGYGEITLAYNLAHASGKSVHEILNMRYDQKMGWGKIAKVLGVKLHDAADNSVIILREAQLNDDADNFKISIQIDLDDEEKNHRPNHDEEKNHRSNNADNNKHKPEKEDDHKNPHKDQEKSHGKN